MICFEILPRNRISDLFIELEIFNHTQFPEIIHSISQNNFEVNKNYICIIIRRQSEVCNVSYEYLRSKFIRLIKKIRMEVCLSRETVFQYIKNNTQNKRRKRLKYEKKPEAQTKLYQCKKVHIKIQSEEKYLSSFSTNWFKN